MNLKAIFPLMLIMALTRIHHFGHEFALPDASLAVFFLAGRLCQSRWTLISLLLNAVLLDYIAITMLNVSDWCISPAYIFLIPTYSVLWYLGKYSATKWQQLNVTEFLQSMMLMLIATSIAFVISNQSFYLFSGRYQTLAWENYWLQISHYYVPYLTSALLYAGTGLFVIKTMDYLKTLLNRNQIISVSKS
ncbi:MAG: hypothetical protein RL637_1525 [Pseudomonadota bacterium]|jgi:hypothetical protein